jgi:hypothetical protein
MWPFSRAPVDLEHLKRLTVSITECVERYRDLEQRFKVQERELDDLHAFYRRLKGQYAQDARGKGNGTETPRSPAQDDPGQPGVETKAQMRARLLTTERKLTS